MTFDNFRRYVDNISEYVHSLSKGERIKVLAFSGYGETLFNSQLPEMITYVKIADIAEKIKIFTNGTLLTNDLSDALLEAGLDILNVSLQGIDSNNYHEVCNHFIDFKRFVDNIKYFYEHRRDCYVYLKIADVALKDDVERNQFAKIFSSIADEINIEHIYTANGLTYIPNQDHRSITTGELVEGEVCNNVFRIAEIQQDGNVYCCARYDGNGFVIPAIGNLENDKFGDIWNRGVHRTLCERLLKHNPTGYCFNCYYSRSLSTSIDNLDGHEEEILLRFRSEYGEFS
jgi:radical SAM protein with 4Fe4S-binding SPASM domain